MVNIDELKRNQNLFLVVRLTMSYLSVNNTINQSLDDDDDNNVNLGDLLKDSTDIHRSRMLHGHFKYRHQQKSV